MRAASYGFIRPALPSLAPVPPSGPGWVHEIKHDGYRLMVRKDLAGVRLLTRNGHDWTGRFPLIFVTAAALQVRSWPATRAQDADQFNMFGRPRLANSFD